VLRVVVDVNVLVSALLKADGPPADVVRRWEGGDFEVVASPRLMDELETVTSRPHPVNRLVPLAVEELLTVLDTNAMIVDDVPTERLVPGDPKDDYLVALARAADAHVIVTGDAHLLDLEDLRPPAMEPQAFLELVERLA